jgi:tetratricopeptide (TPR) repeat protein
MHNALARGLVAAALLAAAGTSPAADPDPPPATAATASPLATARAHVANARWDAALDELRRVNDGGSADWNNLMGYALRKSPRPDYAAAERHYEAALRIDPKHRGALEYSGELALMQGNLAKAEERLRALDKACLFGCEEYTDLKKAVAAHKARQPLDSTRR